MSEDGQILHGYMVHPAAAVFPLLEGAEFVALVQSLATEGMHHPIVVRRGPHLDELLDGRNRLRAAMEARQMGFKVEVKTTQWVDDGRSVADWIWATNAVRRQMGDDALAMASSAIVPIVTAENRARAEATRFESGASGNPSGKKQVTAKPPSPAPRDRQAADARSTAGQVASRAGVSVHKAKMAIKVQRAVDAGEIPASMVADVVAGKTKLRDVAPKTARASTKTMASRLQVIRDEIADWKNDGLVIAPLIDELETQLARLAE